VEEGGRKVFHALLNLAHVSVDELTTITGKRMTAEPMPRRGAGKAARGAGPRPAHRKQPMKSAKAAGKKRR
jgi:hypothetical protein